VAAGAAAVTAALGAGAAGQAAAFAVASGVSMAVVLPAVRRHRRAAHPARSGVAALVGRSALVTEPVDAHHGLVRIGGEVWSARAFAPGQVIPAGAVVDVFQIDGATALVYAEERS
jgi:membrane protein implicated in regulation of membrane protease activity